MPVSLGSCPAPVNRLVEEGWSAACSSRSRKRGTAKSMKASKSGAQLLASVTAIPVRRAPMLDPAPAAAFKRASFGQAR
jgi:hypothetical protein